MKVSDAAEEERGFNSVFEATCRAAAADTSEGIYGRQLTLIMVITKGSALSHTSEAWKLVYWCY